MSLAVTLKVYVPAARKVTVVSLASPVPLTEKSAKGTTENQKPMRNPPFNDPPKDRVKVSLKN